MKNVTQCIPVLMYLMTNSTRDENCIQNGAFKICTNRDRLVHVNSTGNHDKQLKLNASSFNSIASYTFDELAINTLELLNYWMTNDSSPRVISLNKKSFIGLNDVRSLKLDGVHFSEGSLKTGSENPMKYLESLWHLRLSRVNLLNFNPAFFMSFPKLEGLELINTNTLVISPETFKGVSETLLKLRITDAIRDIKAKSFAKFPKLEILQLNGSQLTQLSPGIFTGLNQLQYLDLSSNGITTLSRNIFQLPRLRTLDLHGNALSTLEPHVFFNLNLQFLDLSFNQLRLLPPQVFSDLQHLEKLNLSNNQIMSIPTQFFPDQIRLRNLDLSHNKISLIEPAAFYGLNLQSLNLQFNPIKVLGNYAFFNLRISEILDLSPMNIVEIRPQAFRGLLAKLLKLCHPDRTKIFEIWATTKGAIVEIMYNKCSDSTAHGFQDSVKTWESVRNPIFTKQQAALDPFEGTEFDGLGDGYKMGQQRHRGLLGHQLNSEELFDDQLEDALWKLGHQGMIRRPLGQREFFEDQGEFPGGQVDDDEFNLHQLDPWLSMNSGHRLGQNHRSNMRHSLTY
ncbi:insulin-like growth factor-binding protein complex acid labile subunit [Fopius arisanus]|uniref:Insulin-like growth factor-binding protein complex acid labile subunit n=1 Tax=Fopius arisanus TaxID=64838 RepID=A0A9R1U105_9HYME|nr:PREDICTED: insulin-like growth factor-binding protein complex acid labile subunit [Fopius arisanus]